VSAVCTSALGADGWVTPTTGDDLVNKVCTVDAGDLTVGFFDDGWTSGSFGCAQPTPGADDVALDRVAIHDIEDHRPG
jgi:hypothetical protein